MKVAAAFIISFVAVLLVWTAVVWGCVFLGAAVYPDSIHNPISMLGVMAFGTVAGILTAVVAFRYFKKRLRTASRPPVII